MSRQIECRRPQAAKEEANRGRLRPALSAAALGLGVLLTGSALADDTAEIQARFLGGTSNGSWWSLRGIGAELPMQGGKSWTARGGHASYRWYAGYSNLISDYREEGSGWFLGTGLHFYRGAESKGWYFGLNLDYVSISVDRVWSEVFNDTYGHAKIVGFVPGVSAGYKAVFDNGVTFETDLYVGWLRVAGTGDLKVTGFPGYLGFALGKRF